MAEVVCMGELLVEFVATQNNTGLADAPGFIKAPGGAPANVAVALQKLGVPAAFVGKVGADPFGDFLRASLAGLNVNVAGLGTDPDARTTAVFVAVWDDGRKDLCFYRNPGADMRLNTADIDANATLFDNARCFHYGSISFIDQPAADAQHRALQLARERGLLISYDPNYRPTLWPDRATAERVIRDAFRHCQLAKVSEEEWHIVSGYDDLDRGIDAILDRGVELLLLSRGAKGALATNGDYRIELSSPAVEVVETTGAGDGFVAAMLSRLLPAVAGAGSLAAVDREQVREALRFAVAVGALACTRPGAIPALPTLAEVRQFMEQNQEPK